MWGWAEKIDWCIQLPVPTANIISLGVG